MKTSDFTALSSYNDIHSKKLKTIIMKEEKEYIEKQDKIQELRESIFEGIESGIAENFDPKSHLEALKREYKNVLTLNPQTGIDLGNGLRKVRMLPTIQINRNFALSLSKAKK